jgi:membrane-associated phospholipid phosphatase
MVSHGIENVLTLAELLFGTQLIKMLQSFFSTQLSSVFEAITLLGDGTVLVGLSAAIYWCFDKSCGRLVTYVLLFGAYLNFFLKVFIPWPRPPADLRLAEKSEASYGFPSGHAQNSTTFWTWTTLNFRKRILGLLGVIVVVAVGISRIYLGLHYLAQVIGGWAFGVAVACFGLVLVQHIPHRNDRMRAMPQVLFAFSTLIPLVIAFMLGAANQIDPGQIGGYLFGFSLGALAEDKYVHFTVDISTAQRILRLAIGGALTGLLVLALQPILPDAYLVPTFVSSVIRGLFVAAIVPAVFTRMERRHT